MVPMHDKHGTELLSQPMLTNISTVILLCRKKMHKGAIQPRPLAEHMFRVALWRQSLNLCWKTLSLSATNMAEFEKNERVTTHCSQTESH